MYGRGEKHSMRRRKEQRRSSRGAEEQTDPEDNYGKGEGATLGSGNPQMYLPEEV